MQGDRFVAENRSWLSYQQLKVLRAIQRCRTPALGGHLDQCSGCGHSAISFNSCRNRHCPKCRAQARQRWLACREQELLELSYFHVVFTLPHELSALALRNKRILYELLFRTCAETLLRAAERSQGIPGSSTIPASKKLGGLCQASDGRSRPCASLSGPLYPLHCHQQSPAHFDRWGTSHFPLEGLCTRKQAAPDDTLGIRVLTSLRSTCSSTRLRPHSPVWFPCQPAPFTEHCLDPIVACLRATIGGTVRNRFLQGAVAMSSLRQLDADQPQTDCPRALLIMRATRHVLKQPITFARSRAFSRGRRRVSRTIGASFAPLKRLFTSSPTYDCCLVRTLSTRTPAYTEACFESRNSTKGRLNLHTRRAPPAASF